MAGKILVALDGSERSEGALPWARLFGKDSEIILLRVVEPIDTHPLYAEPLTKKARKMADEYLEKVGGGISPKPRLIVRDGSAAAVILDVAEEVSADWIFITSHGGAALERRIFGGTAEKLLHNSDIPLVIVPSWETSAANRLDTILVPLDGSDVSDKVVPLARKVAKAHNAAVVLTHIMEEAPEDKRRISELEGRFDSIAKEFEPDGVRVKVVIKEGKLPAALVAVGKTESADMVVMSAHGYGSMKRMLLGSTASKLIRETNLPVAVIGSEAAKRLAQ